MSQLGAPHTVVRTHRVRRTDVDGAKRKYPSRDSGCFSARLDLADDDERQRQQAGVDHALDLKTEKRDGALQFVDGGINLKMIGPSQLREIFTREVGTH